jgi:hypothetical protein
LRVRAWLFAKKNVIYQDDILFVNKICYPLKPAYYSAYVIKKYNNRFTSCWNNQILQESVF